MKILAIGNSFSDDASQWLHQIAAAGGVNVKVVSLCIGGCSLQLHWANALSEVSDYYVTVNGEETEKTLSLQEALESDDFDFITFQQASILSGKEKTFYPFIENLFHFVRAYQPDAEILLHQTWSYEKGFDRLSEYQNSSDFMFNSIKAAYQNAAFILGGLNDAPVGIIPCGEAIQLARANPLFDTVCGDGNPLSLNRDGFHASLTYGRYLLAAVWYEVLTGKGIIPNKFKPEGADDETIKALKQIAHKAVMMYR